MVRMSIKVVFLECFVCSYFITLGLITLIIDWTVNTKVDMRFNVKNAHWLSERVRDKILQTVFSAAKFSRHLFTQSLDVVYQNFMCTSISSSLGLNDHLPCLFE